MNFFDKINSIIFKNNKPSVYQLDEIWAQRTHPCLGGYQWLQNQPNRNADEVVQNLIKEKKLDWAEWVINKSLNREQNIEMSIFCAKQVLPLFEAKHPDDLRPRKAIEAAERVLEHDTEENIQAAAYAAYYAASAAANAAYAASAASASAAAYSAANAADSAYASNSAAYAAYAAYYAAYYAASASAASANAAYYASSSDEKKLRQKIIRKAVKILESKNVK